MRTDDTEKPWTCADGRSVMEVRYMIGLTGVPS
jgi:hypothetical protein